MSFESVSKKDYCEAYLYVGSKLSLLDNEFNDPRIPAVWRQKLVVPRTILRVVVKHLRHAYDTQDFDEFAYYLLLADRHIVRWSQ